ncbi:hypothetical protein G6F68_020647 [Rhizopus microsporus]|nr:hypothetical protein G6F68_020647 [Rhizopus microsporus]
MVPSESRLISDAKNTLVDACGLVALMRQPRLHDEADRRHFAHGGGRGQLPAVARERERRHAIAVGHRRAPEGAGKRRLVEPAEVP